MITMAIGLLVVSSLTMVTPPDMLAAITMAILETMTAMWAAVAMLVTAVVVLS